MYRRPHKVLRIFLFIIFLLFSLNFLTNFKFTSKFLKRRELKVNEIFSAVENPLEIVNFDFYKRIENYEIKDWHDYEFIAYEATRRGLGENGTKVILTRDEDLKLNEEYLAVEGLSGRVSDLISVNRSVPDMRHPICHRMKYLKNLPKVTIIVIFHNEIQSLIKRTLHSIVNRSPHELIDALILVNDASTKRELYEDLETYIVKNLPQFVKVVHLKTRVGLINARLEGFRRAKSEVVVFLDSHVEVNVNWLPPLLEPIALNPRTCTIPIHDRFNWMNFQYEAKDPNGVRGLFAWDFDYRIVKRTMYQPTVPKRTPIMLGCAFAINRKYFEDLGGYDDGLMIWNGENYELSLKLHLCGGELLEVPCSRIAHVFRTHNIFRKTATNEDFVARNFKRIAEVWLDDWKKFLYKSDEKRFEAINAGDLRKQKAIRQRLNCKPFNYFVHWIAPEMTRAFATPHDEDLAFGSLRISDGNQTLCISDKRAKYKTCTLDDCDKSKILPYKAQFFHLTRQGGLQHDRAEMCFDKRRYERFPGYEFKHNKWKFSLQTHQIVHENGFHCLAANFLNRTLLLRECNEKEKNQIWTFGFVNQTMVGGKF